jgi:hypothetical protein
MNLMVDYWVTSTYDHPVAILRGEIRYWQHFRRRTFTRIQLSQAIPPRVPFEFRAHFPVTPPPVPDAQPFKAALFFIDSFNKRYKAGKFVFKSHDPSKPYPPD